MPVVVVSSPKVVVGLTLVDVVLDVVVTVWPVTCPLALLSPVATWNSSAARETAAKPYSTHVDPVAGRQTGPPLPHRPLRPRIRRVTFASSTVARPGCAGPTFGKRSYSPWRSGRGNPIRAAPPGTARAPTSPSSPSAPRRWSCACSTTATRTRVELHEVHRPRMARLRPRRRPGPPLRVSASTAPTTPAGDCASTPPSCCSTPTPGPSTAGSTGDDSVFGYVVRSDDDVAEPDGLGSPRPAVGRLGPPVFRGATTTRPRTPWHETVIYETHVKGMTARHPRRARGAARHLRRAWPPRPWSTTSPASV